MDHDRLGVIFFPPEDYLARHDICCSLWATLWESEVYITIVLAIFLPG